MPRPIFRELTITEPPKVDDSTLGKWLGQLTRELQRFSKDVSTFLVQDVAVARVSKQEVGNGFQVMSDGLFVELFSGANATSDGTRAFRPGVLGSWLIIQNTGTANITLVNGAGCFLGVGGDHTLGPNDVIGVRYDGVNWIRIFEVNN